MELLLVFDQVSSLNYVPSTSKTFIFVFLYVLMGQMSDTRVYTETANNFHSHLLELTVSFTHSNTIRTSPHNVQIKISYCIQMGT